MKNTWKSFWKDIYANVKWGVAGLALPAALWLAETNRQYNHEELMADLETQRIEVLVNRKKIDLEKEIEIQKKEDEIKKRHPDNCLRISRDFGAIRGNQNLLFPPDLSMFVKGPLEGNDSKLLTFYQGENVVAGPRFGPYLRHPNDKEYTFAVNLNNVHNTEGLAVYAENLERGSTLIKRIGESKKSIEFLIPPSADSVQEIVIKTRDNSEGDDLVSMCRAPIVFGAPKRKVYLRDFNNFNEKQITLEELDGKPLEKLTVQITVPELGITNVYYVNTDQYRIVMPFELYLHNLRSPTKLSAQISIRDQTNNGEVLSRFNREIDALPEKEGVQLIDPYDSKINSLYRRFKEGTVGFERIESYPAEWLYVFNNFEEGTKFSQVMWGVNCQLEIKSINGEMQEAVIARSPRRHSYAEKTDDLRLTGDKAEYMGLDQPFNRTRVISDAAKIVEIRGNHKSRRFLDFFVYDSNRVPKEK